MAPVKYQGLDFWIPYPQYIMKVKFFFKLVFPFLFVVYRGGNLLRENVAFMIYIAFKMLKYFFPEVGIPSPLLEIKLESKKLLNNDFIRLYKLIRTNFS